MEGKTLPATLLPRLKSIQLDVSNGSNVEGLWSVESLRRLGVDGAPEECKIDIQANAAILHLSKLAHVLQESGLMPRVRSFFQQSWGTSGPPAQFGDHVEVNCCNAKYFDHYLFIGEQRAQVFTICNFVVWPIKM